jgi:hypothetical protein
MDKGKVRVLVEAFPDGKNRCIERSAQEKGDPDQNNDPVQAA